MVLNDAICWTKLVDECNEANEEKLDWEITGSFIHILFYLLHCTAMSSLNQN